MPPTTPAAHRVSIAPPSSFALLCWLAARLWAIGATIGAVFLGVVAVTGTGRLAALAVLAAGWSPFFLTKGWVDRKPHWRSVGWGGAVLVVAIVGTLAAGAPDGSAIPGARVQFLVPPGGAFAPFSPGNLVPEVDQLMACYTVMSVVDPLFTARQASALKEWTRQIYAELDADPGFARLPSAMPSVYAEALGVSPATGDNFIYIPPGLDRTKPAPVLVFFHGSGGDFKAYLWLLATVADRVGVVVVAPSFGMGNWRLPETEAAFDQALQAAAQLVVIDAANIHVAGLSNGGLAVSQLAERRGKQLRSVVLLSPVFDGGRIGSVDFALGCQAKPILVLTGSEDDRVPLTYVESAVANMSVAGAAPVLESVPGANHFLFFSHREQVTARLADWLGTHRAKGR